MQYKTYAKRIHSGFSLIELLVVITIISMMMAILAPSLSKAKESARGVHCLNNLRQLTLAWTAYASENNDKMCGSLPLIGSSGYAWVDQWIDGPFDEFWNTEPKLRTGVLWPYLNSIEVYHCKSDIPKQLRSYSISHSMNYPRKLAKVRNPHSQIVVADDKVQIAIFPCQFLYSYMIGNELVFRDSPSDINGRRPAIRHNIGSNYSFADGHCERWGWEDPLFIKSSTAKLTESEINLIIKESPDFARLKEAMSK